MNDGIPWSLMPLCFSDKKKRERATNFTPHESDQLLTIIINNGFIDVIENKKTDGATTVGKASAWREVADCFNAKGLGPPRDVKALKAKYDTIKRNLRYVVHSDMAKVGTQVPTYHGTIE